MAPAKGLLHRNSQHLPRQGMGFYQQGSGETRELLTASQLGVCIQALWELLLYLFLFFLCIPGVTVAGSQ